MKLFGKTQAYTQMSLFGKKRITICQLHILIPNSSFGLYFLSLLLCTFQLCWHFHLDWKIGLQPWNWCVILNSEITRYVTNSLLRILSWKYISLGNTLKVILDCWVWETLDWFVLEFWSCIDPTSVMLLGSVLLAWTSVATPALLGSVFWAWAGATRCVWATLAFPFWTLLATSKFIFYKTNQKTCH